MTIKYLNRLHYTIISSGIAIDGVDLNGKVTPIEMQSRAQPIIDSFNDSFVAESKFISQQAKINATSSIDNGANVYGDKSERLIRALMETILDELNLHTLKLNSILDASDTATSLSDFKTRVAAIADYPQRTTEQLVTAIKAKIASSAE